MNSFTYSLKTDINYGENASLLIGEMAQKHNFKRVLLVSGGNHAKKSGLLDRTINALEEKGIVVVSFSGIKPNPDLNTVDKGRKIFKDNELDSIIALGGGSVMDSAKAIAASPSFSTEELWINHFENYVEVEEAYPVGVVVTSSSSGSETGASAVITNEDKQKKNIASGPAIVPVFAILDPVLTLSLSPYQTAVSLSDILSHLTERYFTNVKHVDFTSSLIEGAMRSVIESGRRLLTNPLDLEERGEVMWEALLSHNDLLDRGRDGGDWTCHMIEHELSAKKGITHGEGIAIITPSWLQLISTRNEAIPLLSSWAKNVWGEEKIEDAIEKQRAWYMAMGLKSKLREVGFLPEDLLPIVDEFNDDYPLGLVTKIYKNDIKKILFDSL